MAKSIIIIIILAWLGWHLAVPDDLISSGLGRHIKNGELALQGNRDILYKNVYSYTAPEFPWVNSHWLFGVLAYLIWHYWGFGGLGLFYLGVELLTFYIFFKCWERYSSFTLACAIALLSIPLVASRSEIRPEGISYFFCGLFWWVIDRCLQKKLNGRIALLGLCAAQVIWVNMHIYFMVGPVLTALFWVQAKIDKEKEQTQFLQTLFILLVGMCLINPSGIYGLLGPFAIDPSYLLFPTQEMYSVFSLLKAKTYPGKDILWYFLGTMSLLIAPLFYLARREGLKKYIFISALALGLSILSMKTVRAIGLFAFFWIPLSIYIFGRWLSYAPTPKFKKGIEITLLVLGIMVSASLDFNWNYRPMLGLYPANNASAKFFKQEKISGPIFNNTNIGSYLIFYLYPQTKVFIDNRLQPYPVDFLKNVYIRSMQDDRIWHQLDQKYHFNAVFISPEHTDWGRKFIIHRFMDPVWAPVYVTDQAVIFLKRNALNQDIIKRDEIRDDHITINLPS